jgi:hypothetical protein
VAASSRHPDSISVAALLRLHRHSDPQGGQRMLLREILLVAVVPKRCLVAIVIALLAGCMGREAKPTGDPEGYSHTQIAREKGVVLAGIPAASDAELG